MLMSRMPAIAMPRTTSMETTRSVGREAVGCVAATDASFTFRDASSDTSPQTTHLVFKWLAIRQPRPATSCPARMPPEYDGDQNRSE